MDGSGELENIFEIEHVYCQYERMGKRMKTVGGSPSPQAA